MAGGPAMVEIPAGFPLPKPTEIVCPGEYIKHKTACFKFGSHSSYEMAKTACEAAGARLADIEPVFSKYIRDKVRTMGGNDFWIGSFMNRGRTYKQKGRTSCPIMRGQMINDALYGLVDCNSANRYICQKYGPVPQAKLPGMGPMGPNGQRLGLPTTIKPTTTTEEIDEASGGLSPVIYVVITAVVLILAMIALKLLIGRYFRDKKKAKSGNKDVTSKKKEPEQNGGGRVFYPKWRTKTISKTTSIDSAVPPSNPSPISEKKYDHGEKQQYASRQEKPKNEMDKMGRPRVNGPQPTRKPPHLNGDILDGYHGRTMEKHVYDRDHRSKRHRRAHSDPRSDYGGREYGRHHSKRRHSHYSEYSQSTSDSYSDDSSYSGPIYGPTKVYQRHPSRSQVAREPMHYHIDPAYYRGFSKRPSQHDHRQRRHRSRHRSYAHPNHENAYHFNGHRNHSRHISHHENRYGAYGKGHHVYSAHGRSHLPGVGANVYEKQVVERQYFPQPHRLMSWASPTELKELNNQSDEALVQDTLKSFPREPIRVSRQIHQSQKKTKSANKVKKSKKSRKHDDDDDSHQYETLDETRRNKRKKSSHKNKSQKKHESRNFARASESRLSMRSVASIQSRRLPTPPT